MIYFAGAIALMVVLLLIAASECYRLGHLNETNRRDIQILRKELWNKKDELTSAKIDGGLLRDELHSKVSEVSSLKDEIERQKQATQNLEELYKFQIQENVDLRQEIFNNEQKLKEKTNEVEMTGKQLYEERVLWHRYARKLSDYEDIFKNLKDEFEDSVKSWEALTTDEPEGTTENEPAG